MHDIKLKPDQGFVLDRHPLLTPLCFQKPSGIENQPEFQEGLKQRLKILYGQDIKPDYQYVKLPEDKDEAPPFQLQFIQLINGYIALLNQLKSQELKVELKILQKVQDSKQLEQLQQEKIITEHQARELRLLLQQRANIKEILPKIAKDDYFLQPAEKIEFHANLKRKLENLLHYLAEQYADNSNLQIHSRIAMTFMQFADAFQMCTEGINAAVMEAYNKWLIADDIPGWVYQKLESVAVTWAATAIRRLGAAYNGTDSHVVSAALRAAHVLGYGIEAPTNKDNYKVCESYYEAALAELDAEYRREFSYETLCMHIYETQLGKCRQWLADFTRERLTQPAQALRTLNKNMQVFAELKICKETDVTSEDEEEVGCYQLHPKLAALLPAYCALYSLQRLLDLGHIEDINLQRLQILQEFSKPVIDYAGIKIKLGCMGSISYMFHDYLTTLLKENDEKQKYIFRFIHISQYLLKNKPINRSELSRLILGNLFEEKLIEQNPLSLISSSFTCDPTTQEIIVPLLFQHPYFKKNPRSLLARSEGDKLTYGMESVNDRVTLNTFKFFWSFLIEQVEQKSLTQKELVDFVGARDSKGFTLITNKELSQSNRLYGDKILWLLSQIKGIITYQDELWSTDVRRILKIFHDINMDNYHPDRFFIHFIIIFSQMGGYYRSRFQERLSLVFAIIAKQCDDNLKHLSFFRNLLSFLISKPLNFAFSGHFTDDLVETVILLRKYIEFDLHHITLEHDQKDEVKIHLSKLTLLQTAILETNAQVVQQLLALDEKISIGHDDLCLALKEITTVRQSPSVRSFLRNPAIKIAILQTLMQSHRVNSTIQYSELLPLAVAAEAVESKAAPVLLTSSEDIIDLVFLPLTDESRRKPSISQDTALQWGGIAAQLITLKKYNIFLQILFKISNIMFSPIYDILDFSSVDDEKTASIDPDITTIKKLIRLLAIIREDESQLDLAKLLFLELVAAASQPSSLPRGILGKQLLYTRLLAIVAQQCCGEDRESKHERSFYQQLTTSEYDIRRRLILHRHYPALDLSQSQRLLEHGKFEFKAETPLRAAIRWGDDSLFQELIQVKAQRGVIVDGENALHCLLKHAHEFKEESSVNNILAGLIVDGASFGDALDEHARQEIVINLMLITAEDKHGETALHLAAASHCPAATFKHLWDNANDYCQQLREDKVTTTTVPDLKRLVSSSIKAPQPSVLHHVFAGEDEKQYQIQKLLLVCSRINLLEELIAYAAEFSPLSKLDSRRVLLMLLIALHNKQAHHAAVYVKIFCNLLIQKKLALTLDDILITDTDWCSKEGFHLPKLLDIVRMQGFAEKDILAPAPLLQMSQHIERQEFSQAKSKLDYIIYTDSKNVMGELDSLQMLHDTDLNPLSSQRLDEFYRYFLTTPSTSLIPNQEIVLLSIIANKKFLNALMCVVCANNLSALEWLLSSPTTKPVREKSLLTRDTTLPLLLAAQKTGYAIFKKLLHYLRQNLIRKEWQELFIPENKEHLSILHEACMQALSTNQWENIQLLLDEYSKLSKQDALPKLCKMLVAQMDLVNMAKIFAKFYTESIILPTDLILVLQYLKSVIKVTDYRQFCSILSNQLGAYPFIDNDHTLIAELLKVTGFNHEKTLTHDTILLSAARLANYETCAKVLAAIASCAETPEAKQQFIDYINPLHPLHEHALLAAINREPKDEKIVELLQMHSSPAARAYCQVKTAPLDEKLTPDLLALALYCVIKQNKYVAALKLWQEYTEKHEYSVLLAILMKFEAIPDDETLPAYLRFYQHIADRFQLSDFFNEKLALIQRLLVNEMVGAKPIDTDDKQESVRFVDKIKKLLCTQSIDFTVQQLADFAKDDSLLPWVYFAKSTLTAITKNTDEKECKEPVKINTLFKELLKQARITQSIDEDEVKTIISTYQALLETGKVDYDSGLFKQMFSQFLLYSVKNRSWLAITELLQSYQKISGFPPQVELNAVLVTLQNPYPYAIAHFPECLAKLCHESTSETILKIIKLLERYFATEYFRELCWQLLKQLGATAFQFPSHSLVRYLLQTAGNKCVTQVLDEKTGDTALTFAAAALFGGYSLCYQIVGGYTGVSFESFVDHLNSQNKNALILATERVRQDAKKIKLLQGLSSQPAITYCQIKTSSHNPEVDVDSQIAMYEWLVRRNYQLAFTDLFNTTDFTEVELKAINKNRLLASKWLDAVNSTLNQAVQLRTEQKTEYKISQQQLSKEQYVFSSLVQGYKILEETTSAVDAEKIRILYERLLTIQQLDDNDELINAWLLEAIHNNCHEIIPLFFSNHKHLVNPNHQDPRSEQTLIFVLLNQIARATALLERAAVQKSLSFIVSHANWNCCEIDSKGRTALERSITLNAPTFKSILDHSSDDVLTKTRADNPSKTILDDLLEQKCSNDAQKIERNTKLHYFLTTLWDRFAIGNKSLSRMNPKGEFYAIKVKQLTKIANLIVQYYIHCKSQIPRAQLSFFTRRAPGDQLSLSEWQATAGQLQQLLKGKALEKYTRNYTQRIARIPELATIHQFSSRYLSTAIAHDSKMRIT